MPSLVSAMPGRQSEMCRKCSSSDGTMQQLADIDAAEMQVERVDQHAAIGTVGGSHDVERLVERPEPREGREFEIDGDPVGQCQIAGLGITVDQEVPVVPGLGPGAHDQALGAEFAAQFKGGLEGARITILGDPGQLDIENLDAGVPKRGLGGADHALVVRMADELAGHVHRNEARADGRRSRPARRYRPARARNIRSGSDAPASKGRRPASGPVCPSMQRSPDKRQTHEC